MADCITNLSVLLLLVIVFEKSSVFCSDDILLTKAIFVAEKRNTADDSRSGAQSARSKEQTKAEPMNSPWGVSIREQAAEHQASGDASEFLLQSSRLPASGNSDDDDDDGSAASLPLSADEAERLAVQLSQFDDRLEDDGLQSSSVSAASLFDDEQLGASAPPGDFSDSSTHANGTFPKRGLSAPISELSNEFLTFFDEMWRLKNSSIRALARLDYFSHSLLPLKSGNDRAIIDRNNNSNNFNRTLPNRQSFLQYISILSKNRGSSGTLQFRINKARPSKRVPTVGGNNLWPLDVSLAKRKMRNHTGQQLRPLVPVDGANSGSGGALGSPTVGARFNSWLSQLNQKINNALLALSSPLMGKLGPQASKPPAFSAVNVNSAAAAAAADDDERVLGRSRPKRSPPQLDGVPLERRASSESNGSGGDSHAQAPAAITSAAQRSASGRRTRPSKCAELDSGSLNKCKSSEALVHSSLNTSLPGTLMAIEDNCRHISFLLTSCWPKNLQQTHASLSASNESMLTLADFPLPPPADQVGRLRNKQAGGGNSSEALPPCSTPPRVPEVIQVRINWMWIHLCVDKRFRHGYVENLKCLSLWNQRRAEAVCSSEFARLRAMLSADGGGPSSRPPPGAFGNNRLEVGATGQTPVAGMSQGSSPAESNAAQAGAGVQSILANQQLADSSGGSTGDSSGELESKALCCMFDLYLRCVYRQAIQDCGRAEGQFVANFISRIGTDDLKYMCNGQMRSSQRGKHVTGSALSTNNRRQQQSSSSAAGTSSNESGLFIESNYCSDARIHKAIYGPQQANAAGDKNHFTPTTITGSSGNLRPMNGGGGGGNGGRANNRGPIGASSGDGINSDSTSNYDSPAGNGGFSGGDSETSGASQTRAAPLASLTEWPLISRQLVTCLAIVCWALSTLLPLAG